MKRQKVFLGSDFDVRFSRSTSIPILNRTLVLPALALVAAVLFCSLSAMAGHPDRVAGRILVKGHRGVGESALRAAFAAQGAEQEGAIDPIGVRVLRVPERRFERALTALKNNKNLEFAEPDYVLEPALVPNDTYYSLEWHLTKIQAPQAWDITTGSSGVIIAILDSGVDGTHPDLAAQMVPGWNVFDNNSDTKDVTGHGTGVAGNACATANNGVGIAALAWGCKIMPVRVSDPTGVALTSMIAAGITYAADHGARVANASFSLGGTSSTLSSAAQYLQSKGGVFTAAAGNEATVDPTPDDPAILRVSATDSSDLIASFSNTGNNVDLSAPGVNIVTTTRGGGYGYATGTSAAAPQVAGVAALVMSANPDLTGIQVQTILKQSADDLGTPGWDPTYGAGRLNAYKAVQAALNMAPADTTPPTTSITSPAAGSTLSGTAAVNVSATDNVAVTKVDLYLDGTLAGSSASAPAVFSWDTTTVANGTHTLQAKAYDAAGNFGTSASATVTVQNTVADTTAPTVRVSSPSSGSSVAGVVTVSVSATDNVAVTREEWYLDGALSASSTTPTTAFSWDSTKAANGSHTLLAKAYDAAGNVGSSTSVTVTVQNTAADTTPPTVAITKPTNGTVVGKSTTVSVVASDNVAVTKVNLLVDGKQYATSSSATPTFTWNTSKLKSGTHTLQAIAYDAAGNFTRSSIVSITK